MRAQLVLPEQPPILTNSFVSYLVAVPPVVSKLEPRLQVLALANVERPEHIAAFDDGLYPGARDPNTSADRQLL